LLENDTGFDKDSACFFRRVGAGIRGGITHGIAGFGVPELAGVTFGVPELAGVTFGIAGHFASSPAADEPKLVDEARKSASCESDGARHNAQP
jgi:hypothetical protein